VPKLDVLNPVADSLEMKVDPALRPDTLDGKRIGLYWNVKAGGNHALDRVEQLLSERYEGVSFYRHHGSVGWIMRHATAEDTAAIRENCDVVVGTSSD
jgi:hypothetical protein